MAANSTSATAADTRVAHLNVSVPADARVYLQEQKMSLTGPQRRFVTPALPTGNHIYSVRVEVDRDGKTLTKTTEATVAAGREVNLTVIFDGTSNDMVASR
jgi:uncharacterized protein (TIGR03000 family)